jgi:hypothetical protein
MFRTTGAPVARPGQKPERLNDTSEVNMPLWLWDFFAYWGIASAVCCFIVLAICARLYQLNQLFEDTYL